MIGGGRGEKCSGVKEESSSKRLKVPKSPFHSNSPLQSPLFSHLPSLPSLPPDTCHAFIPSLLPSTMAPQPGVPARLGQYPPQFAPAFAGRLLNPVERVDSQPENPYSGLITDQTIVNIPSFTLESGVTLYNVPVAYTSRGQLSPEGDNALVICHALSGSADVADWWGPLLGGPGQAFDTSRFFVICLNSLGSPYGSASAVTYKDGNPEKGLYGPEFPLTTVRDDVRYVWWTRLFVTGT